MYRFVFHHKKCPKMTGYTLIDNSKCKEYDHRMWSEIAGFKVLLDKLNTEKAENDMLKYADSDWISLNHYRRLIDPDYCNRTTVAQPTVFNCSLAQNYAVCHSIEDLKRAGEAVNECYPHLAKLFEQVINGNVFLPYNMGIMTVGQFKDYANFLFTVLGKVAEKIGTKSYEERLEYIKSNPEQYTGKHDDRPDYQARIESFLAERLSTVYWMFICQQIPVFPATVRLLEKDQQM